MKSRGCLPPSESTVSTAIGQCPGFDALAQVDEAVVKASFIVATVYVNTGVGYVSNRTKDGIILSAYAIETWRR